VLKWAALCIMGNTNIVWMDSLVEFMFYLPLVFTASHAFRRLLRSKNHLV
jgi:hypothetical protein